MKGILEFLDKWVEARPDEVLYRFLNGRGQEIESYTYRQFDECTNHVALRLKESKTIRFGDRVVLLYPPGLDFIVAFFACIKLGAVPVPVPPLDNAVSSGGSFRLAHILRDSSAVAVLTSSRYKERLPDLANSSKAFSDSRVSVAMENWLCTDRMYGAASSCTETFNPSLFLQYTSGSTQDPRGVLVSHENVVFNCHATLASHEQLPKNPIAITWLPHFHDMGLIGYYLFTMIAGGTLIGFSSLSFLKRPLLWLEAISTWGGMISSAPNFAYEYCLREDKVATSALNGLDLSSLRVLMSGAEPVRASTYDAFLQKFKRCGLSDEAYMVSYGLAENTLTVSSGGRARLTLNAHSLERGQVRAETPRSDGYNQVTLISCGAPLPGVDVKVVNLENGKDGGEGNIGEVWIDGASKAGGYFNKKQLTHEIFFASLNDGSPERYLRTGDIGFLFEGELYVCGRLKETIIIRGQNHYPSDIEAVVERTTSDIRPACVAAFALESHSGTDGVAVIAECEKDDNIPDIDLICQEIRKACQIEIDLFAIVARGSIVKTTSGKIARLECKRRWDAGQIKVLKSRTRLPRQSGSDFIDDLMDRFAVDGLDAMTLSELGVDSLTLVELSIFIESQLPDLSAENRTKALATIHDMRLLQAITVGELRSILRKYASKKQLPLLSGLSYVRKLQTIDQEERKAMKLDARLPRAIEPRHSQSSGEKVLLTGATGFFGSFVLEALLRQTEFQIVALTRADNADHARTRTKAALLRTGLLTSELNQAFEDRVSSLSADIRSPNLGLSARDWDRLSHDVNRIYHCAAEVDYIKPYRTLRPSNVDGTVEVLRLACEGSRKSLHLASTTFIFGFNRRERCSETDCNIEMADLNFGYSQSKWVAEQLAFEAAVRGLHVNVYRPAFITASLQGRYVERDLITRVFAYMIRHGISVDAENQLSILPVDHCANNFIALSNSHQDKSHTFHLTADEHYTIGDVCSHMSREFGYNFKYLSLEEGVSHMNAHCGKSDPLFTLRAFFNRHHRDISAMAHKRYDSRVYRESRMRSPSALPEPDLSDTVRGIVSFLQRRNLVPVHFKARTARREAIDLTSVPDA